MAGERFSGILDVHSWLYIYICSNNYCVWIMYVVGTRSFVVVLQFLFIYYLFYVHNIRTTKGMFGNCFFPLFSVFKNNFLFLRLKNLFGNSK